MGKLINRTYQKFLHKALYWPFQILVVHKNLTLFYMNFFEIYYHGGWGGAERLPQIKGHNSQMVKASCTKLSEIFCWPILLAMRYFGAKSQVWWLRYRNFTKHTLTTICEAPKKVKIRSSSQKKAYLTKIFLTYKPGALGSKLAKNLFL